DLAAVERLDVLYAALPVTALADDVGPLVVLQRRRHDLAAAGTQAVDHADHGEVEQTAFTEASEPGLAPDARPDRHNQPIIDEQVGDLDGRVEQTARIETQVEHEALDTLLLRQLLHHGRHVPETVALERGQTHVGDLVLVVD